MVLAREMRSSLPFSFIASSNCILYERAKPVFVDIEKDTGNIDPDLIEDAITPRTKAILPVDAFGQPARLDSIRQIADRHGLVVIEDSCEALGSEYKGIKAGNGTLSHSAVFAFYPNKHITPGEGGGGYRYDTCLVSSMCNEPIWGLVSPTGQLQNGRALGGFRMPKWRESRRLFGSASTLPRYNERLSISGVILPPHVAKLPG